MCRSRLAKSLQHCRRSFSHRLSAPSSEPVINRSFQGSATISSPWRCLQSSLRAADDVRICRRSSLSERRSEPVLSRFSLSDKHQMSTLTASTQQLDGKRVARSNSSAISTSGRNRACCFEQRCSHTSGQNFEGKEKISVTFVDKDGEETHIKVPIGMSMLEAAHENDIELEGACEGSLACSTCHVIVMDEEMYNRLPEPSDEENDMLDLAFGLTETSRLGCQVIAQAELDGLHLALPAATRNFAVDGHVPKPH